MRLSMKRFAALLEIYDLAREAMSIADMECSEKYEKSFSIVWRMLYPKQPSATKAKGDL